MLWEKRIRGCLDGDHFCIIEADDKRKSHIPRQASTPAPKERARKAERSVFSFRPAGQVSSQVNAAEGKASRRVCVRGKIRFGCF